MIIFDQENVKKLLEKNYKCSLKQNRLSKLFRVFYSSINNGLLFDNKIFDRITLFREVCNLNEKIQNGNLIYFS